MNIPDTVINYIRQIDRELKQLDWPRHPEGLYEPCSYLLSLNGKRIRPTLTLMAAEMYGTPAKDAYSQALAVEVFHNFTLMHDDIMDQAPLRRGKQTVHKKWNLNTAVLSGDAMIIKSYQLLIDGLKGEALENAVRVFNQTALEVCEGQQLDMNFETARNTTPEEYIEMIRLKTAVLPGAALKIGAGINPQAADDLEHLYQFGQNLGIAFQIKDDLLDAFGRPEQTGKQNGGDILADKKTLLLLSAMEHADQTQKKELDHLLHNNNINPEEKVDSVLRIYNDLNIQARAETIMNKYADAASESLSKTNPVNPQIKNALHDLSRALLEREW